MLFPYYKDINLFENIKDVQTELLVQQKNLLELKTNIFLRTAIRGISPENLTYVLKQPHLKKHNKRRIAQLKFRESFLKKKFLKN